MTRQVKLRKKKQPFGINEIRAVFRRMFDSPDGRIAMQYILRRGHFFTPLTRTGNQFEIYRNEGARELAIVILGMSKIPPQELVDERYENRIEEDPNA